MDVDAVFKALASPARRRLLDALREDNGQTLTELCACLEMTRQAVTQHLEILEEANLVASVRRGREKLHYLNPVPIHAISARWIAKYEEQRLDALQEIKKRAEGEGKWRSLSSSTSRTSHPRRRRSGTRSSTAG
jgi:DNA-binding transcriptional ArsR family regulator